MVTEYKSNRDVNNVRRETITTFRNKEEKEISERKMKELERNNKNQNIRDLYRGICEFKKGPWCIILLEKLIFTQLAVYRNRRFITVFTRARHRSLS
jgi:hypothetical protein